MDSFFCTIVNSAVDLHKEGKFDEAAKIYNRVLNVLPDDEQLLFLMGDLYARQDNNGLAVSILKNLVALNPAHSLAWCNLGVAYRKENHNEQALTCWENSIKFGGLTSEVCNNMASLHADTGDAHLALEWCEKALTLKPTDHSILWQKGLAALSLSRFKEGFELYESRQYLDGWHSRPTVEAPIWDGKPVDHLYLHGEQGVGDEVMFLSMFDFVAARCTRITLELNGKVIGLSKLLGKYGNLICNVVTDETPGDYDAKFPIGSLFNMFGMPDGHSYIFPNKERVDYYKAELAKLGKGPYVAVCWFGGTKKTRVVERSLNLKELAPILKKFTCVSAQYNAGNPCIEEDRIKNKLAKINDASCGDDLAEQAALFAAVDAVVTVQQTAVHVAGAVGAKTFVLVPERPQWRYGLKDSTVPWYRSVKLHRKGSNETWDGPVARVKTDLIKTLGKKC